MSKGMGNKSDLDLWVRFKKGDDDALALLYGKYADELYSYGLKIVQNESLVKDCLQEVFILLIDKRKSIKITSHTHLYFFKSLRNKLFEEIRSKNRKLDLLNNLPDESEVIISNIEQHIIQSEELIEIRKELNAALEKLTDRQKEIIYLKYTKGYSTAEIAELLEIDNASVRKLLYRTLKTLKNSFKYSLVWIYLLS